MTTNVVTDKFLSTIRYYMPIYLLAGVLITIGGAFMAVYLGPATPKSVVYGLSVIVAVGTGPTIQLGYAVATLKVAASDIGNAISLQNLGLGGELREAATRALVNAMQRLFALVISSGAIMIVVAAGMKRENLFGEIVPA